MSRNNIGTVVRKFLALEAGDISRELFLAPYVPTWWRFVSWQRRF
jgi:hypothetical protein